MKHPCKQMALPYRQSYIDSDVKGLIAFIPPQEVAYREVMGRPSPEPFAEGTLAAEQWNYRKGYGRQADELCHPRAKPRSRRQTRRGRKPVGA